MPDDRRETQGFSPVPQEEADPLGHPSSEETRQRQRELRGRDVPDRGAEPSPRGDEPGPVYPDTVRDMEKP